MRDRPVEVAVVGAGPTGMVLALWLARRGVSVRIVDKAAGPGTSSRALVVHARTLELYRQLGLADDVVARGLVFDAVNLWARGRHVGRAAFGDIGRGLTPYPHILIFPQDQHEALLVDALAREGVEIERRTELVGFSDTDDGVLLRVRKDGGAEETFRARYLAGCDGAHSRVREELEIGFPGGTYQRIFYVADARIRGPVANQELHVALDEADFVGIFPLAGEGAARIVGAVRREPPGGGELGWEDVSRQAAGHLGLEVEEVRWFSTYRVHHRVARRFRRGRAFLAGDAAHIHSPVGGQGMNTGIGDAVNLAWKLAAVVRGEASPELLDSYEPERIAFARTLVATTDRAFSFVTRPGPLARAVRLGIVPRLVPSLVARRWFRRLMFRTVSQTAIEYRQSPVSVGRAGRVHAGDRLPWVSLDGEARPDDLADNFVPLRTLDWQLHVYGEASSALRRAAIERNLPLFVFPFDGRAARAGLARNAAYLVRPDGHVAFADPAAHPEKLAAYLRSTATTPAGDRRGRTPPSARREASPP